MTETKLKIAFFGNPEFSVWVLDELGKNNLLPDLIVTNPDEPKRRKLLLTPPPTKDWALKRGINFIQPINLKTVPRELLSNYDLFLVVAYGKIIPENIINLPRHGTLNIHPSLLPKYRGPSPVQSAILNGDEETGVTLMLLDREMDHGPIIAKEKIELKNWRPYLLELKEKMAKTAALLFLNNLEKWIGGKIKPEPQNHKNATFTKKIDKNDGLVDAKILLGPGENLTNVIEIERKIRALTPDPGVYTLISVKDKKLRIKITKARIENDKLVIEKVIPEGKREMSWEDWKRGNL